MPLSSPNYRLTILCRRLINSYMYMQIGSYGNLLYMTNVQHTTENKEGKDVV